MSRRSTSKLILPRPTTATSPSCRPSQPLPPSVPISPTKSRLGDPIFEALRDELYENADFSEKDAAQLQDLHAYLREYMVQSAIDEDYAEAKRARNLVEKVHKELENRVTLIEDTSDLRRTAENQVRTMRKDRKSVV
jgi:hypothetical protein